MRYRINQIKHQLLLIFINYSTSQAENIMIASPNTELDMRGYIVNVGSPSPDFTLEFPDGSNTSLEKVIGNVVMLQFTASWCSVCRDEMPHIEKDIWKPYQKAGLKLIGIDRDEPAEIVKKFAKEMKITYPLAMDLGAAVFQKFAEKDAGVTRNIILDSSGTIVFLTRLFDPIEFKEMISVIHKELVKKNSQDIVSFEKEIKYLKAKKRNGAKSISAKLYRSKLKLKKEIQRKYYLNRIDPD